MAFIKTKKTQTQALTEYLNGTGRQISGKQAQALFGIKNIRARAAELRKAGFKVETQLNRSGLTAYRIV